jgi:hypothetical protein
MKTSFFILLVGLFVLPSTLAGQPPDGTFAVDHKEVAVYLDSITKLYNSQLQQGPNRSIDFSTFVENRSSYVSAFNEAPKLYSVPDDKSTYKKLLEFGDTLLIPLFNASYEPTELRFLILEGDLKWHYFIFCVTKDGDYGFICSDRYIRHKNIEPVSGTDYLLFRWSPQAIVLKDDFTKRKYFNTTDIVFSDDNNMLVFSVDIFDDKNYLNMYTFQLDTWTETFIGKGHSPTFIENEIVYWAKEEDETETELVHLYGFTSEKDEIIFVVPDTLTLWLCGPDRCFPQKIEVKENNNEAQIALDFCSAIIRPGDDECGRETTFIINRKGEIIGIE